MSQKVREEMLPGLRPRYASRGREGRSRIIDDPCEQFGDSPQQQHAIKLLGAKNGWGGDPLIRKGRPPLYGEEEAEVLWKIAKAAESPCGKRLARMRELWLPHYEARDGKPGTGLRERVLKISAAQTSVSWSLSLGHDFFLRFNPAIFYRWKSWQLRRSIPHFTRNASPTGSRCDYLPIPSSFPPRR